MTQLQVIARYTVTFGNELEVASLLTQLADATRAEPGNLSFATYRQLRRRAGARPAGALRVTRCVHGAPSHRALQGSRARSASCRASTAGSSRPSWWTRPRSSFPTPPLPTPTHDRGRAPPLPTPPARLGLVVRDNPESQTYDALVGDEIAGTMLYEHEGPRLVLTHTAVQPRFQHQGIATALIAAALDDIRTKGKKVTILCPLVAAFIDAPSRLRRPGRPPSIPGRQPSGSQDGIKQGIPCYNPSAERISRSGRVGTMSVAIVTGASRGLGQALAEGLAREGWSLVIDGRDATHSRPPPPGSNPCSIAGERAVGPWPATSPIRRTAGTWSPPPPSSAGSTCWSTTPARSARRPSRPWPTTRSTTSGWPSRSTWWHRSA